MSNEMKAKNFLRAAREYRSWDEPRMEAQLTHLGSELGYELEITEHTQDASWCAAMVKNDDVLDTGQITLCASETATRHEAMENLLLMLRFMS